MNPLEFKRGLKLSQYMRIALRDVRAALATGKYRLDGDVWCRPQREGENAGTCSICLAGGIIAGRNGFDPSGYCESWYTWEDDIFQALDAVRRGSMEGALRVLGFVSLPENERQLSALGERLHASYLGSTTGVPNLELLDSVAAELEGMGL